MTVYCPDGFLGEAVGWDQLSLIEEPINSKPFLERVGCAHVQRQLMSQTRITAAFLWSFISKVGIRWAIRHSPAKVKARVDKLAKLLRDERGVERLGLCTSLSASSFLT